MRRGGHGQAILREIHGNVPRHEVRVYRGETILQPGGVAVGDVQVRVMLLIVGRLLALAEYRPGHDVPRGKLSIRVIVLGERASVRIAQDGALPAQGLREEEPCLVGQVERGGMELDVFQVGDDAAIATVVVARRRETILQTQRQPDARSQRVEPQRIRRVLVYSRQPSARQYHTVHRVVVIRPVGTFVEHTRPDGQTLVLLVGDEIRDDRAPHEFDQGMLRRRARDAHRDGLSGTVGVVHDPRRRVGRLEAQAQDRVVLFVLLPVPPAIGGGAIERHHAAVGFAQSAVLASQQ
mmetsp:Transcript_36771/g.88613  ORF Transcript_36771/g.88613 Transcript_36771/m.88613 type:complete len:294 (+) Transcript_36771:564-1445(+)